MQFDKTISLAASPDAVWAQVTDLGVLAACLPGARLDSVDADGRGRGHMAVRVGSMRATFEGAAEVVQRDDAARTLELRASGTSTQGTAEASIVAEVTDARGDSVLQLRVVVDIAGPLARLGQGMAEPVVDRLVDRFAVALSEQLATDVQPAEGHGGTTPRAQAPDRVRTLVDSSDEPLDLGGLLITPRMKQMAGVAGIVLLLLALLRAFRRPGLPPAIVINLAGPGGPVVPDPGD